jgi:hypothetical protein
MVWLEISTRAVKEAALLTAVLAKLIAAPSSTTARTPLILFTLTRPRHPKTIKASPLHFRN